MHVSVPDMSYLTVFIAYKEIMSKGIFYILESESSEDVASFIHFLLTFTETPVHDIVCCKSWQNRNGSSPYFPCRKPGRSNEII